MSVPDYMQSAARAAQAILEARNPEQSWIVGVGERQDGDGQRDSTTTISNVDRSFGENPAAVFGRDTDAATDRRAARLRPSSDCGSLLDWRAERFTLTHSDMRHTDVTHEHGRDGILYGLMVRRGSKGLDRPELLLGCGFGVLCVGVAS